MGWAALKANKTNQIYKEQSTVIHITQYYGANIQVMTVTEYVNLQGDR